MDEPVIKFLLYFFFFWMRPYFFSESFSYLNQMFVLEMLPTMTTEQVLSHFIVDYCYEFKHACNVIISLLYHFSVFVYSMSVYLLQVFKCCCFWKEFFALFLNWNVLIDIFCGYLLFSIAECEGKTVCSRTERSLDWK